MLVPKVLSYSSSRTHWRDRASFSAKYRLACIALVVGSVFGVSGCATGSVMMASVGPAFGTDGGGLVVSLEYTRLLHEQSQQPEVRYPGERPRSSNLMGIGLTSALAAGWMPDDGWHLTGLAGADYVPFLWEEGFVRLGGLAGYGISEEGAGFAGMVPRLGMALTPWTHGSGKFGFGGRFQCLFGVPTMACGPTATAVRLELGE